LFSKKGAKSSWGELPEQDEEGRMHLVVPGVIYFREGVGGSLENIGGRRGKRDRLSSGKRGGGKATKC